LKKTTTKKNYHDKSRKKTRKKSSKRMKKKQLNPALNHAAIIRKQKKLFDLPHIRTILNIRIE